MSFQENHLLPTLYAAFLIQLFCAVFLMIALLNRQRDLALLTFLVLVTMTGARIWNRVSLRGLSVQTRIDKQRVFPGEQIEVNVRVANRKWLPIRLYMEMSADEALPSIEEDPVFRRECGLLWYQQADFRWQLQARRRGVFQLGPENTTAGDFLGFFIHPGNLAHSATKIVVYPRIVPLQPFTFPRKDLYGLPGGKSPVQDPVYILGTRDYQHWQPSRYIHWKASARRNRLQEKVFEPSAQAKILLVVDVNGFANHRAREAFERTLETVASMALQCERQGYALGFWTNGLVNGGQAYLPISRGAQQLSSILEILARLEMTARPIGSDGSFNAELNQALKHWGIGAICFSYKVDEKAQNIEMRCAHRKIPVIFILCCQQGEESPAGISNPACMMTLDQIRDENTTRLSSRPPYHED